jgi:hypothetical protein
VVLRLVVRVRASCCQHVINKKKVDVVEEEEVVVVEEDEEDEQRPRPDVDRCRGSRGEQRGRVIIQDRRLVGWSRLDLSVSRESNNVRRGGSRDEVVVEVKQKRKEEGGGRRCEGGR